MSKYQQIHFSVWMSVYYTVTGDMFRQLMWPSSGWQEQAYNYKYNVSQSAHSSLCCLHHGSPTGITVHCSTVCVHQPRQYIALSTSIFVFKFKFIYSYSLFFHFCDCINIYSNWWGEQFCSLSLNMIYILSLQQIFQKNVIDWLIRIWVPALIVPMSLGHI